VIRLDEAKSVARALLVKVRLTRKKHAVIIHKGAPEIRRCDTLDSAANSNWDRRPNVLVGVYDESSSIDDIAVDILVAEQGEYATR
jgi:hypothetical protein